MGDIDEYDILECFSIMKDGGATDDAALEFIRQTYPQTLKNGVYSVLLQKIGKSINQAQNGVNTEQKEKVTPDAGTLQQYLDMGFTLYAQKEGFNGKVDRYLVDWREPMTKYTKGASGEPAALRTAADLQTAINNGVVLFSFLPSEKNFLCFDIDSGHDNGIDGLKIFTSYFAEKNIVYDFFTGLAVYTETPSGGRHLYFNAGWITDIEKYMTDFLQNVEIRAKGNKKTLTAAGSTRHGKLYTLHGKLADAPALPNMLIKHITPAPRPQQTIQPHKTDLHGNGYTLAKLVDFVINDKAGDGRNNTAYSIGFRIGKQYDLENIVSECRSRPIFSDFAESELRTAIKSGINNSRH